MVNFIDSVHVHYQKKNKQKVLAGIIGGAFSISIELVGLRKAIHMICFN